MQTRNSRFTARGILTYNTVSYDGWPILGIAKAVIRVDQGISDYYRSLIPAYFYAQPQLYPAHITVVRTRIEDPDFNYWRKYQGETITFEYNGVVQYGQKYFYLDVFSDRIGDIREELGLPRFRFTELGAERGCYHLTIANRKQQCTDQTETHIQPGTTSGMSFLKRLSGYWR
jgi:hypothetical protein